jgi:hypothetical protein
LANHGDQSKIWPLTLQMCQIWSVNGQILLW